MVGKSFLMTNILIAAFEAGYDVLHITTENTEEQALGRAEAILWGINYRLLMNCSADIPIHEIDAEEKRPNRYMVLRLFPGRFSVDDVVQKIMVMRGEGLNFRPRLIGIDSPDWLKLVQPPGGRTERHHLITEQYEFLKAYAEEDHVAILTTSHVKMQEFKGRRGKRNDRLDLGDLADSAGKVRIADVVVTINTSEELERHGALELYACKLRDQDRRPFSTYIKRDSRSPRFFETHEPSYPGATP
jgi:replicative DNA helicase